MSRWLRVISWVSGIVVIALVAALVASVWTIRRSFPQTSGTLTMPGLNFSVSVMRDDHGIPQIYASSTHDLFFAQGYVQAQDRFFQMDFRRHLTSGTLSELFGRAALKTDEFVRTLGWRRVAEEELPLLSQDTRNDLDAYSAGVNAYLADHSGAQLSLEYAVLHLSGLDYTPAKWTPVDSLSWLKAMAWDLGSNIDDELERSIESVHLSDKQIAELFPAYPYRTNEPIVTQGAVVDNVYEQNATRGGTRLPRRPPFPRRAVPALRAATSAARSLDRVLGHGAGIGSNAWVVSGAHTASGAPLLANDLHLAPTMPGVWYQMGLHCTVVNQQCPFDVTGFTFAGLPGVVVGHNESIAWGFTNLYPDTEDLYLEKVVGRRYLWNGSMIPLTTRKETFDVRGEDEPVTITVRSTRDGPLISDLFQDYARVGADAPVPSGSPPRGHLYAVALRWTALQPGRTADALIDIDKARNWDEFRGAARLFSAPAQNMVYADVHGNIGYQAPGDIPIRRTGDGDWPVPGWDPAYQWAPNDIPFDALPNVLNPKGGVIVTANQAITDPKYPYYIGDSFDYGYRAQRIRDLLETSKDLTVDDMERIQFDDYSTLAATLVPYLERIPLANGYDSSGQRILADWNDDEDADSAPAAYFNVVWSWILKLTFDDQLPERVWPSGDDRWWQVIFDLLKEPHNSFWDDVTTPNVRETRDDILKEALLDARNELTETTSRDPNDWQWGKLHTLTLRNDTLGRAGSPVAFLFNRGPYPLSGGPSVVDATSWDASQGFDATVVPSMRMVIPLDNFDQARWINSAGESGHAYDAHYTDQTQLWVKGETLPWLFSPGAVEDATQDTLTLRPPS